MSVFVFIFIADKNCNEVLSESNEEIKVGFTELLLSLGWVKGGQPLPPLSYLKHSQLHSFHIFPCSLLITSTV